MSYVVSARKYRPQIFEEVVGQLHVTSTIKNALLNDKLAHAFLFCGPRGVGKTTCARLLAKVINMPDPKAAVQDGSYAESDIDISLNIVELDAASNNSVENIRTLIEQVRFQPQQGKYKVFIIDEVHMLSQAAFNAFLKTLEEPPPYAIFILATTERHKILPTILSRCQLYDFRRIQIPEIIEQLEKISGKEGIEVEHDALYVIAEKADGAMRDALSIFDRIASAGGNRITLQSVIENLNILDFDYFFEAVKLIMTEDASGILLLFDKVLRNGFEGDIFINGLAQHLRNLMYSKQEPTQKLLQMSDALKERYLEQSNSISYRTILTALNLCNKTDLDYPRAKEKRLHVEIALLKMCYAGRKSVPQISDSSAPSAPIEKKTPVVNQVVQNEDVPKGPNSVPPTPAQSSKPSMTQIQESIEVNPEPKISPESIATDKTPSRSVGIPSVEDILKQTEAEIANEHNLRVDLSLDELETVWSDYVSLIESTTTKGILTTVIKEVKDDQIFVTVPSNIAKEEIQQETDLYSKVRDHFSKSDLSIHISVNRESFPDIVDQNSKKIFTAKEKYDHLKAVNPLLDDLVKQLNLKLEQ